MAAAKKPFSSAYASTSGLSSVAIAAGKTLVETTIIPWLRQNRSMRTIEELRVEKGIDLLTTHSSFLPFIKNHPRVEKKNGDRLRYKPIIPHVPSREALIVYLRMHPWGTRYEDLFDAYEGVKADLKELEEQKLAYTIVNTETKVRMIYPKSQIEPEDVVDSNTLTNLWRLAGTPKDAEDLKTHLDVFVKFDPTYMEWRRKNPVVAEQYAQRCSAQDQELVPVQPLKKRRKKVVVEKPIEEVVKTNTHMLPCAKCGQIRAHCICRCTTCNFLERECVCCVFCKVMPPCQHICSHMQPRSGCLQCCKLCERSLMLCICCMLCNALPPCEHTCGGCFELFHHCRCNSDE
jgi:hypothetical protein